MPKDLDHARFAVRSLVLADDPPASVVGRPTVQARTPCVVGSATPLGADLTASPDYRTEPDATYWARERERAALVTEAP